MASEAFKFKMESDIQSGDLARDELLAFESLGDINENEYGW